MCSYVYIFVAVQRYTSIYVSYLPLLVPAKEEDRYNQTGKSDNKVQKEAGEEFCEGLFSMHIFFFRLRSSCLQLLRGRRKVGNNLDIFGLEVKLHSF